MKKRAALRKGVNNDVTKDRAFVAQFNPVVQETNNYVDYFIGFTESSCVHSGDVSSGRVFNGYPIFVGTNTYIQ